MKQVAFASIAALAIAGFWAPNLLSQQAELQPLGAGIRTVAASQKGATAVEATQQDGVAELREEYLRLAESRARTMPEYELRDAVREMQIQSELDPIVQQLREIVKKYAGDPREYRARTALRVLLLGENASTLQQINRLLDEDAKSREMISKPLQRPRSSATTSATESRPR